MLGDIAVSLNYAPWIANKKGIPIGFTFNRQAYSIVPVSNSVHNCFVNRDIGIFGLFDKSATWISPLIRFKESSFLNKGSHITYLFGERATKSSFERGQTTPLGIFNCSFKAEQANVCCCQASLRI